MGRCSLKPAAVLRQLPSNTMLSLVFEIVCIVCILYCLMCIYYVVCIYILLYYIIEKAYLVLTFYEMYVDK